MKRNLRILLLISIVAVISLSCVLIPQREEPAPTTEAVQPTASPQPTVETITAIDDQFINIYERVNPGVVSIQILSEEGGGLGTGFVWDEAGHVVTNFHVVMSATDLEVDFPGGFKTRAEVIGTDPDSDLAVLELDSLPEPLPVLELGESRPLQVGQRVVAIGNPHGLNGTMTVGIVSALNRSLDSLREAPGGGVYASGNIIQTDAAINPGNSGGPLLDLEGKVVGLNYAIQSTSFDLTGQPVSSGLGFAIPIDIAKNVVPDLIETGKHEYAYVGILGLEEVSLFTQEELNLPQATGVYVVEVVEGSPASEAGLIGGRDELGLAAPGGDLITAVDGNEVLNFDEFISYLLSYKNPGDSMVLTVLRGEEEIELELTLSSRP
ncbi:MAG: putative serine protease HtrA [Chloroflexi bacterium]|nr:putative serine protease HtrA [Chloroflexota bacterium]